MDFKSGKRQNPTMNAMASMLNDTDVENVAAYLSAQ
jgi:cytochrome c553